jgi:translation initiation factor 1A
MFKDKKKDKKKTAGAPEEEVTRARIPRGREVIGILEQRLGGSRTRVKCLDGKSRVCRIPGRLKRKLWVREGDFVLVEPWEYDKEKGDIVFKYKMTHVEWLRRKGYIKEIEDLEEF